MGPLGPYGPLSDLGPLNNPYWSIANFFGKVTIPYSIQKIIQGYIYAPGAPMSKDGPLGYKGPLASEQYYGL